MMYLFSKTPNILRCCSVRYIHGRCRIGNRDIVGHGINGSAVYRDDPLFPFPAIRFKENTKDICALREKEKGDWRQLCCFEKKALYRASFCQTFAEFQAPTGTWKFIIGWVLISTTFGFWMAMFYHYYVNEPLPSSLSKAAQKAQLRRMLEVRVNPIDGISSLWDYDNDKWKSLIYGSWPELRLMSEADKLHTPVLVQHILTAVWNLKKDLKHKQHLNGPAVSTRKLFTQREMKQ